VSIDARASKGSRGIGAIAYVLIAALVLAACTAFAQDPTGPEAPAPDAAAPVTADDAGADAAIAPDAAPPTPASSAAAAQAWATAGDLSSGLAPLKDNGSVPLKWLPPGAFEQDRGPSEAVFPPQKLTIRFNHKLHVGRQLVQCKTCHAGVT
jgi:hypothetical protein